MKLSERPLAPNPYDLLPPVPSFQLTSQDLQDGHPMPQQCTAAGGNISPQLSWSGFPPETRSFVVTCFDPDAPTPSGYWHWVIADIDVSCTELPQGAGTSDLELEGAAFHLCNDSGEPAYQGAAPPAGDYPHRYIFVVHALDIDSLPITDDSTPAVCSFNTLSHTLARATLIATYQNPQDQ